MPSLRRFAVIDIGTNSVRLAVVQPEPEGASTVLSQQKEVIRLGEGEFAGNTLTPAAMDRAMLVLKQFADSAKAQGAKEMVALATAAVREATNSHEFLHRARREAGLEVRVISGAEEARLIYLGVVTGLELVDQEVAIIDIGGGSTELAAGTAAGPGVLESMKLGAIRMAGIFTEGLTEAVPPELVQRMRDYTRAVAVHSLKRIREHGYQQLHGSSGTILNMLEIAARRRDDAGRGGNTPRQVARLSELQEVLEMLAQLTLAQRRKVPGINPERADIIVAGGTVLVSLMEGLEATEIRGSERALREGIVVDHLLRRQPAKSESAPAWDSVRSRSVLQLLRRCQADEAHALEVARLAVRLFDEFGALGLHHGHLRERELLNYAALLHDVGGFVSYTEHHKHGFYLVRNSPLLGFDTSETETMAALVLHHRKALPKRKSDATRDLSGREFRLLEQMSICLRLAEAIARGHLSNVRDVACRREGEAVRLELVADGDCQLALWALEAQRAAFRSVFGADLLLAQPVGAAEGAAAAAG